MIHSEKSVVKYDYNKLIKFKKDSISLLNFPDTKPKTFIIHF